MATRRQLSREYKLEAVKLVKDAACRWRRRRVISTCTRTCCASGCVATADPQEAFPGKGVMKPEQAEIERLKKVVNSASIAVIVPLRERCSRLNG